MNRLYFGDCLTVMQDMPKWSVDLIYLDPPFNSQRQYNNIYKDATGRPLPDQVIAFNDMWILDDRTEEAIRHMPVLMRENGIDDATTQFWQLWMNALRDTNPQLMAYLSYMVQRLMQMKVILKPTGSVYLHCDPTASHYIKVMMDAIFGHANFRNEIVWCYTGPANTRRWFPRKHDTIFFYAGSQHNHFDRDAVRVPYASGIHNTGTVFSKTNGEDDEAMREQEERGKVVEDWWVDIPSGGHISKQERMGYRTQKPLALLERIITASCPPDGVVLDPFCGCATTLDAAHKLGRRWIGIDIAVHAVNKIARQRLTERLGLVEGEDYEVSGVPQTAEGALELWRRDPHQFQTWVVELAEGFVTKRKSGDGGVDGRLYFDVPGERLHRSMVIEVKGGQTVNKSVVHALRGVLEREPLALLAGLIVQHPLGPRQRANFAREMGQAGAVEIDGVEYPRMQLLTVPELLAGKQFDTPRAVGRHEPQPALPGLTS